MNKGTMIAMGVLIVLAGFCFVWMIQQFSEFKVARDKARTIADTFGQETVELLTLNWKFEDIRLRSAQSLVDSDEDGSLSARLLKYKEMLGPMKSSSGETTIPVIDDSGDAPIMRATYTADVVCENGTATIKLDLARQKRNSWQIIGIEVTADEPVN